MALKEQYRHNQQIFKQGMELVYSFKMTTVTENYVHLCNSNMTL